MLNRFKSVDRTASSGNISGRRLLVVEIVEARNLTAASKNGKSDPAATLSLQDLGGRDIKKEAFSTKIKKDTVAPVWNETFNFGATYDLDTTDDLPNLSISLVSKGALAVSETLLGVATVSLDAINPEGAVSDLWVPVEPSGRATHVSGEVHVRVSFNRAPTAMLEAAAAAAAAAANPLLSADVLAEAEQANADEESQLLQGEGMDAQGPNEVHIFAVQARKLQAADKPLLYGTASSDPKIRFEIEGQPKKYTKFIRKTLNPQWNEEIVFEGVVDASLSVKVTVEDHNDVNTSTFLGRVAIDLSSFSDQKPRQQWYKLMNKKLEADGIDRGEVELRVTWKFNVKVKEQMLKDKEKKERSMFGQLSKGFSTVGKTLGVIEKEDEEAEEEDNEVEKEEVEKPLTPEEEEAKKAKEAELVKDLTDIEIKDGDYQIQVHVIEARDLKAENFDGTSDPIVYVECFGQKRNTQVVKQVTSCVFDEVFIFNQKNMDKETFENGFIRIACYDSGMMGAMNTMIGAYAIDASLVYTRNKDHEVYRQWVALMDDEDGEDVGVQGYLKISIAIIGPGEKMKVHDEDAERAAEIAKEAAAGGDIGTMVLAPPTMVKEWKYVVIDLYKAEGLPVMDGAVGIGALKAKKAGTDAFVTMSFGGGKPLKSPVKTVKGESRKMIKPIWNSQLWYPVAVPTMTQVMKFTVFDKDDLENEVIGHVVCKFNQLKNAPRQVLAPRWYNIYGAPEFKQGKLLDNITKGAKELAKKAKQTLGADIDWSEYYNNTPDKASTFKGRLLMKMRLVDKPPPKKQKELNGEVKPFRLTLPKGIALSEEPKTVKYSLQALVFTGVDVPQLGLMGEAMRVKISMGIDELSTSPVKNEQGLCRWNEWLKSEPLEFPSDFEQIPDIFVYLLKEDLKPICFTRIKAVVDEVNEDGVKTKQKKLLGFTTTKADWYLLREDKSIDALSDNVFPGQLLLQVGFGLLEEAEACKPTWKHTFEQARKGRAHQVRVHLYQGRNLPAADANGLCDPYVKVKLMKDEKISHKRKKTLFPTYYQTMLFHNVLIPEYDNYALAPPVVLRLYDTDMDGDDYLGTTIFYLKDAILTEYDVATRANYGAYHQFLPDPLWKSFFFEVPGDSQGDLLMMVELVPTDGHAGESASANSSGGLGNLPNLAVPLPLPNILSKNKEPYKSTLPNNGTPINLATIKEEDINITPPTRDAFIEFLVIGMRDMAPFNFQEMQNPFLDIVLQSFGTAYKSSTAPSKRPTPSDPNYLEKILLPVKLPERSIFSTPLSIMARDTRLGGYLKPVVGVCQIDLSTKLPWDLETYVAPCTDLFVKNLGDIAGLDGNIKVAEGDANGSGNEVNVLPGQNQDKIALEMMDMQHQRDLESQQDDFIALHEPAKLNAYIQDRIVMDDTGAGIFGALHHINTDGSTVKKKNNPNDAFADPDLIPDEGEQPPAWSINRKKLDAELESELLTTPFETYSLMRGKVNGFLGSTLKVVGRLKGLCRVIEDKNAPSLLPKDLMDALMKPTTYCIRLYALRGVKLAALDTDIFGKPQNSDPYLKVMLGKKVFNDRENAVDDATDVDFYKLVTFETQLPGISQLKIHVYDKDLIGSDDVIGSTVIDLEDRWFDNRWQSYGKENMLKPGDDINDPSKVRLATKPVERRGLYVPGISQERGKLECWVDILTSSEDSTFPPDDISLPPKQIFEVRVVVWKAKNVPPMDTFEGMSDLFVKIWPEGCDVQETDTHWRAKKGKASWNYRMLFDVELGHNTRAMKFPYLHLQLWDRDLLKWSDCAGEGMIDLGPYYRKAYKRNIAIKLFEKKKGIAAKRAAKRAKQERLSMEDLLLNDLGLDIPPDEEEEEEGGGVDDAGDVNGFGVIGEKNETASSTATASGGAGERKSEPGTNYAQGKQLIPDRDQRDSDDDDNDDDDHYNDNGMGALPSNVALSSSNYKQRQMLLTKPKKTNFKKQKAAQQKRMELLLAAKAKKDAEEAAKNPGKTSEKPAPKPWYAFWRKNEPVSSDKNEKDKLLTADGEANNDDLEGGGTGAAGKTEEEKKKDEDDEAKELITTFKNMTGLWDIDPEDSAWYHLEQRDKNDPTKVTPMGSICYSIQIWPKDKATVMAVGAARNDPNTNPFLPPPVGRLKFSLNPFVMGSELCGPALCAQFFCCLLCIAFVLLMVFCQPFLNIIINLIFVVY